MSRLKFTFVPPSHTIPTTPDSYLKQKVIVYQIIKKNPRTMDLEVDFTFRKRHHHCSAYIDYSEYPCYIFVILRDQDLIVEFGDELSIKNDCENLLAKNDDYPELVLLRQAIFDVIKTKPGFLFIKEKYKGRGQSGKDKRIFY